MLKKNTNRFLFMKRNILLLPLLFLAIVAQAKYDETFSTPDKGQLVNHIDDFTGLSWALSSWDYPVRLSADYFQTTASGVLECNHLGQDVLWTSPDLTVSATGNITLTADFAWEEFDAEPIQQFDKHDYIFVAYQINHGNYIKHPNVAGSDGDPAYTVRYFTGPGGGDSATTNFPSIAVTAGDIFTITILVNNDHAAEKVTIDKIQVSGVMLPPPVLDILGTSINCPGGNDGALTLTVSGSSPFTYDWSNGATTQNISNLGEGTYTVTVTDANSATSTASAGLLAAPAFSLTTVLHHPTDCPNSDGGIDLNVSGGTPGYTFDWSNDGPDNPDNDPKDIFGLGQGTFTVTVTDANSCSATKTGTLIVDDNFPPVVICPPNVTINADGACHGLIGAWDPVEVLENCDPDPTITQSLPPDFQLAGHDDHVMLTLFAEDYSGNLGGCEFEIVLKDVTPPSVTCPADITVAADANCSGTVINPGPVSQSDNCSISQIIEHRVPDVNTLHGHNDFTTITYTVFDFGGNNDACSFKVTLKDDTPPAITCQDVTLSLDANGYYEWTLQYVLDNVFTSFTDNCGIDEGIVDVTKHQFYCSDVGSTNVGIYARDINENQTYCEIAVTTTDPLGVCNQPPVALCQDITVNLSNNGQALVSAGQINNGSYDPDGTVTNYSLSQTNFGCSDVGANQVTLTVTDNDGATDACTATVTIQDVTAPTVYCRNATVQLNSFGQATMHWSAVSNGAYDACGFSAFGVSPNTFTCADVGGNTVTLSFTDLYDNIGTCTATVTVQDMVPPTAKCKNVLLSLDGNGDGSITAAQVDNGSTDACGILSLSVSPNEFTCADVGANTVTLTVTDNNNNVKTCTATVTLSDITSPSIVCPGNTTVAADASCSNALGSYSPISLSDNCPADLTASQSPASSTMLSGHNDVKTVTLTADDGHGNTENCTFTVTLKDVTKPSISCPANTTVAANANCSGTLGGYAPTALSDNCTANPAVTQSPASGTVLSGHNDVKTVTLTADDGNGNTEPCTFTVTLKDVTKPTVVCKIATVNLNAAGTGSITTADVYQSGADNCGTVNQVSVTPNTFNCSNLGINTVTLTVNDGNGNTNTCTATVKVQDAIAPTMLCKPATLFLNAIGQATLTLANVNNGSFDNCTITTYSLSQTLFTCANIGDNPVILSGRDQSMNLGSCSTTVTILDAIVPTAKCKNQVLNLGPDGTVAVLPSLIDNGSSDNCSFSLSTNPDILTCADIGTNVITLHVTDAGGNTDLCTALVTVQDASGPAAHCKDPIIYLDDYGHATLQVSDVDNGSSDNCGISNYNLSQTDFNCSELDGRTWPVIMTITDNYNHSSTCVANVTVKDAIAPTAICENTTVELSQSGYVVVYSANLAANSTDNCSVWSYSPIAKVYTTANIGENYLTIVVKDWSGNDASCVSVVTVEAYNNIIQQQGENRNDLQATKEALGLRLYPNPTAGDATLDFELPADQDYRLMVYDLSGRVVLHREGQGTGGWNSLPIAMGNVAPGVYMLTVYSDKLIGTKRLIIQE